MPYRWCSTANLRRTQIESGIDITFNDVFKPIFVEQICNLAPKHLIEIGAGTGHLAKSLAGHGFNITAIEPSKGMFTIAQEVLANENVTLKNCSSFELPKDILFDLAYSHLVAHVVEDLFSFFSSISSHLSKNSFLLFSIPHPCFYQSYKNIFGEEYNYMKQLKKDISFSITKDPYNVISGVPYHHRPLSSYINSLITCGFTINSFDEIYPPKEVQNKYGKPWENPRYCLFKCQKL